MGLTVCLTIDDWENLLQRGQCQAVTADVLIAIKAQTHVSQHLLGMGQLQIWATG